MISRSVSPAWCISWNQFCPRNNNSTCALHNWSWTKGAWGFFSMQIGQRSENQELSSCLGHCLSWSEGTVLTAWCWGPGQASNMGQTVLFCSELTLPVSCSVDAASVYWVWSSSYLPLRFTISGTQLRSPLLLVARCICLPHGFSQSASHWVNTDHGSGTLHSSRSCQLDREGRMWGNWCHGALALPVPIWDCRPLTQWLEKIHTVKEGNSFRLDEWWWYRVKTL
jgi:hypothetical protein